MVAPIKATDVSVRNSLRDFDISPPNSIFQSYQRIDNETSSRKNRSFVATVYR